MHPRLVLYFRNAGSCIQKHSRQLLTASHTAAAGTAPLRPRAVHRCSPCVSLSAGNKIQRMIAQGNPAVVVAETAAVFGAELLQP